MTNEDKTRDQLVIELEEIRTKHQQLFESMISGFALHEIITDATGKPIDYRFLEINPAFEELTGLKRDAIVGKRVKEAMPGIEMEWIERYGKVALTGEPIRFENYAQELDKYYEVVAYCPKPGQFACLFDDITSRKKGAEALEQIRWLLADEPELEQPNVDDASGDLTALNRQGKILDAVGPKMLRDIVGDFLAILGTSAAVFEANGDYALRLMVSDYCRFLDNASFRLTGAADAGEALSSEHWHCHKLCWRDGAAKAMSDNTAVETSCPAGLTFYTIPIQAHNKIIGAITVSYGDPPTGPIELEAIARLYEVGRAELEKHALAYKSRPPFILKQVKRRVEVAARIIGLMIEQKQAQDALTESEERYRGYVDNAPYGVFVADKEGRYLSANRAASNITGYSVSEILSLTIPDLIAPESAAEAANHFQQAIESGYSHGEMAYYTKQAQKRYWTVDAVKLGEDRFLGFVSDTTEQHEWRHRIMDQKEQAQLYLDIAGTMIVALNRDGIVTLINKKGAEIIGAPQEEITGKRWFKNYLPENMQQPVFETFQRLMCGEIEANEHYENPIVNSAGEERLIAWHNQLLYDTNGEICGSLSSGDDVTDRRRTERELAEVFKMSVDMICIADLTTNTFLKVNPAFSAVLGYTEEELLSKSFLELIHPDDIEGTISVVEEQLKRGETVLNFENRYRGKDGRLRTFDWVSHLVVEQGVSYAIARDITEQRRILKEHEELQEQLNRSQKLESLGRLAGGVAHDFNNLVTVITGNVTLVLDQLDPSNPLYELLKEIEDASARTAGLTSQLLAFGRKQLIEPRVVDMADLLANMKKLLGRLIGEEINVAWQIDPIAGSVKVDPSQMEQVVVNLVINARDAMPDGGRLVIETSRVELDESYAATHIDVSAGSYVMLAISDSGCGMPPEELPLIFEPFYTTKRKTGGSGLGLATTFGIISQHGGTIEVYSEVDSGTTFKIYMPLVKESAQPLAKPANGSLKTTGSEKILVVEDEPLVRNIAVRVLKKQGYTVYEASDGVEALALIEKERLVVDMLLTDVIMPNMNGRELANELEKRYPKVKVLFTSGYTENVIAHRGVLDADTNFISKPYAPSALGKKIREILDG